jgi:hypothetical protein
VIPLDSRGNRGPASYLYPYRAVRKPCVLKWSEREDLNLSPPRTWMALIKVLYASLTRLSLRSTKRRAQRRNATSTDCFEHDVPRPMNNYVLNRDLGFSPSRGLYFGSIPPKPNAKISTCLSLPKPGTSSKHLRQPAERLILPEVKAGSDQWFLVRR